MTTIQKFNRLGWAIVAALYLGTGLWADVRPKVDTTGASLADGAVTTAKLADSSVTSAKIAADTIVAADIATGGVATAEILDGTIGNADVANNAVTLGTQTTGGYAASATEGGSATSVADDAVTGATIAIASEAEGDLMIKGNGANWVRLARGAAGTVLHGAGSGSPAYSAVVAADITAATITTTEIAAGTILNANIANSTIALGKMAALPELQITLCPPGMTAVTDVCKIFVSLSAASFTSGGQATGRVADLASFTHYRITTIANVAAVTGDVFVQCDTDPNFGTVLGTMNGPTNMGSGTTTTAWTAMPAGCIANVMYLRFGMGGGNTTESPSIRVGEIEFNKGG